MPQGTLSTPQQEIVTLVQQGVTTISAIASRLGKSDGIVRAQLTRIKSAGQGHLVDSVQTESTPQPQTHSGGRPQSTGSSSNQEVLKEAHAAGEAVYDLPDELVQAARNYTTETDVHPMVLLGVTIQFVKLVGGRLAAHQLIEQVYEALRAMVSDGSPKVGDEDWSAPWPLNSVEMANAELKKRIAELEGKASGSNDA